MSPTAISPDGKYLAFCLRQKLFIQVVRTGEKRSLALPEGFYLARADWFPDGTKLLLWRIEPRWTQVKGETIRESNPSLWSLSMLGGTPQKILDNAFAASVSPDGSLIAFSRRDLEQQTTDIWLAGANGENPRRIHAPTRATLAPSGPQMASVSSTFTPVEGSKAAMCTEGGSQPSVALWKIPVH
ncbi:MAG: hypothetical protein DMG06_28100 [Acidobacteria bacterium]|nr:MAG: hypothetical protein DMG06_28100 [Acidobacteriota bacterium]